MKFAFLPAICIVLVLSACTSGTASETGEVAQEPSERQQLVEMYEKNTKSFHAALKGLTEAQWNYREAEDRWSIGEVAEHIIIAEGMFTGATANLVLASEPNASMADSVTATDEQIAGMMADRSQKFEAPADAVPQGVYASSTEALEAFDDARAATMGVLKTEKDLRMHFGPHPAFGTLDAYRWLLFSVAHANRHLKQIEQVKADANYPA